MTDVRGKRPLEGAPLEDLEPLLDVIATAIAAGLVDEQSSKQEHELGGTPEDQRLNGDEHQTALEPAEGQGCGRGGS